MDELISRKAVIDAIKTYWKNEVDRIPKESTDFDVFTQICDSILSHNAGICKAIDKLPPAQPKHGRWERHYSRPNVLADMFWHCSACGYKNQNQWAYRCHNYCPHCGAYMMDDEEQDEID